MYEYANVLVLTVHIYNIYISMYTIEHFLLYLWPRGLNFGNMRHLGEKYKEKWKQWKDERPECMVPKGI